MFPNAAHDLAEDARFLAVFREAAAGRPTSFATFMALALYHPELGYYRRGRRRVGLAPDADFYTASSTGAVFGELVAAAAARLLAPARPAGYRFVELGAEGPGVLTGVAHPFAGAETRRLGDDLACRGDCVVFSNELFDAQPFHRLVRRAGAWRELGVAPDSAAGLQEVELPELSPPVAAAAARLPADAPDGYRLDLPLAAAELCAAIARAPWRGVFIACDYGKTWSALAADTPAGTARAYHAHRQERDLLARPGRQDLTCDVCWDWLEAELAAAGFTAITLESQERFLLRQAGEAAARIAASAPPGPDPRRSRLQALVHPALFGQRFQVLHARRD